MLKLTMMFVRAETNEGNLIFPLAKVCLKTKDHLGSPPFSRQVIHLSGFTPSELESYRQQIFVNVRDGILGLFLVMEENRIEIEDPSLRVCRATLLKYVTRY